MQQKKDYLALKDIELNGIESFTGSFELLNGDEFILANKNVTVSDQIFMVIVEGEPILLHKF